MPTLGHVAVGLAAARCQEGRRPSLRPALVLTALATFPDLDLFLPGGGAGWAAAFGHRGALHSLLAAAVAAALGGLLLDPRLGRARAFLLAFLAAASHGLLDALAQGGDGVMLLWPFSRARLLSPWPLLPPSPFSGWPLSLRGLVLTLAELLLFAPLLLYALRPSWRRPAAGPERSPGPPRA